MARLTIDREGVFVPVPAGEDDPLSPTRGQARGRTWRRSGWNLYVPSYVDDRHPAQRIVEAAAAAPGAAVTGWAALHWLGARWFTGESAGGAPLPVPLAAGDRRGLVPRPGSLVSDDWLFHDDVIRVDGLPITVPERSVSWEVRRAGSLAEAVRIIDMGAYSDLIDLTSFAEYVRRLPGRPGVRLLRAALELADENAWSPMESEMRVLWRVDGNRPRPLCNPPLFDLRGRHLFTPDLFDPVAGVAGEYNGAVHDGDAPRSRDLDREDLARRLGIEVVTMMAGDRRVPGRFPRRLGAAYARAAAQVGAERRWTLEQPEWWVDTSTVAARRALGADLSERWLRHRAA